MAKVIFSIPLLILSLLTACQEDIIPEHEPQTIIEGWIEAGSTPKVYVTSSIELSDAVTRYNEMSKFVDMKATAYVTNEKGLKVGLTGRYDEDRFIPFIYETGRIVGHEGETYKLDVKTTNGQFSAECTIPPPHKIADISLKRVDGDEHSYTMEVTVKNVKPGEYGRIFIKPVTDSTSEDFMISPRTEICAENGPIESLSVVVTRPYKKILYGRRYFLSGERVVVRLSMMSKEGFDIWADYDLSQSLSRNPLFPSTKNIGSNIVGGTGYWLGYNSDTWIIDIP